LAIAPWPSGAIAQTAVQNVGAETAQGTYQTSVQRVVIGNTQGVTLSWLQTGETLQRVWLDDPSRVVVDFDGCLPSALLNSGEGGNSTDQCGDAQVMRVRQLNQRIEFPVNVTASRGNLVSLTVVTTNPAGQRKIYQFQLVLTGSAPPISLINIIPAPALAPAQLTSVSQEYQQTILRQLSQGLAYAEASKLIDTGSPAYTQLRQAIALMQQGTPFAQAVQQSNVPNALIDRIRSYGRTQSTPSSTLTPSAPLPAMPAPTR
jgi:hypothetical protein